MYKNLCCKRLGGTCQQNEMIEMALTYDFAGTNIDLEDMSRRSAAFGSDYACRFLLSAPVKIGSFGVPFTVSGTDEEFKASLDTLKKDAELAATVNARQCQILIEPTSDHLAYQENFELHRTRLAEVADVLAEHEIRMGISLQAASALREGKECPFIHQADPLVTLIKTIGRPNVGLAFDLWNWTLGDGTIELLKSLDAKQIVLVELADLPAEVERDSIEAQQRLLPSVEEDSPSIQYVQALCEMGYEGPVSVTPHASQTAGTSRDGIVQRMSSALDKIFSAAGVTPATEDEPKAEATAG